MSMIRSIRTRFAAVILLAILGCGPLWAVDADALLAEVDQRMQPGALEMYRKIINVEPDGRSREFVLYTVRSGADSMAAVFLDPASERGRSTLRLGENMWLYIPDVGRPIRITSLQSVVGGVFSKPISCVWISASSTPQPCLKTTGSSTCSISRPADPRSPTIV